MGTPAAKEAEGMTTMFHFFLCPVSRSAVESLSFLGFFFAHWYGQAMFLEGFGLAFLNLISIVVFSFINTRFLFCCFSYCFSFLFGLYYCFGFYIVVVLLGAYLRPQQCIYLGNKCHMRAV